MALWMGVLTSFDSEEVNISNRGIGYKKKGIKDSILPETSSEKNEYKRSFLSTYVHNIHVCNKVSCS